MSSNPMNFSRPRGPPSASSNSSNASSSVSSNSTLSTPPRSAMSLSSRHSLTMPLTSHGHGPISTTAGSEDIPFLGTPFAFALERPYEYPFPSPATESCPNLASSSSVMGSIGLGLVHIPPSVQSPTTTTSTLPSVLPPSNPPPSASKLSNSGPFASRMLLRRRSSYAAGAGMTTVPPVPPSLTSKARDLNRRSSITGRNTTQR